MGFPPRGIRWRHSSASRDLSPARSDFRRPTGREESAAGSEREETSTMAEQVERWNPEGRRAKKGGKAGGLEDRDWSEESSPEPSYVPFPFRCFLPFFPLLPPRELTSL